MRFTFSNTGLIIIKPDARTSGFGSRLARPIIENFKSVFPKWNDINWSSVYAEISETNVYICDYGDEEFTNGNRVRFDDADFAEKLETLLEQARTRSRAFIRCRLMDSEDEYTKEDALRRSEAALKRMLATPHKPHSDSKVSRKAKVKKAAKKRL